MIRETQEVVCGIEGKEDKEAEAVYAEVKMRLERKITALFELKESEVSCLAAATEQTAITQRALRRSTDELCAAFNVADIAQLAE